MQAIEPVWLNTLLGVILPFFIEWIKQSNWKREINFLIAIITSIVVGIMSAYFTNNLIFEIDKVITTTTYIFTVTQIIYEFIVKELEKK